jgi:PAS domain S-box-containing protein
VVPFVAASLAAVVAVLGRLHKGIPGGLTFTLMMCAVCEWMLCAVLSNAAVNLADKRLFLIMGEIGMVAVSPLLVQFSLWYRSRESATRWWQFLLIWAIPLAILVLMLTNELLHALWMASDLRFHGRHQPLSFVNGGQWRQLLFGYSVGYALSGCIIIAQPRGGTQPFYMRQTVVLIIGFVLPILGGVLALSPLLPHSSIDPIGIGFSCMGLVLLIGMRSFRLMDVVPVARNALIEKMTDGLIVFDQESRIVDINPVAETLLGSNTSPIGTPAETALGAWYEKVHRLRRSGDGHVEAPHLFDPEKWYDLQLTTLRDNAGAAYCWLLIVHDLTDRKKVERERETLIDDLGEALADIQTLSGLLPICASCKKIRDDTGYWQQLEQYITTHSEAQFSHGICPDCARKLYPGLLDEESGPST